MLDIIEVQRLDVIGIFCDGDRIDFSYFFIALNWHVDIHLDQSDQIWIFSHMSNVAWNPLYDVWQL